MVVLFFLLFICFLKSDIVWYNNIMEKIYDVLVLGGGVAGMSAAVYASRAGKSVGIVEKFALGGQVLQLEQIENFPSQTLIDGINLAQMFQKQVEALKVEILFDEIVSGEFGANIKQINGQMQTYKAKTVVIATGLTSIGLETNENDYLGRGVSFCATCDGNFFRGKTVAVASRGGSGMKDALYLANLAAKVILIDCNDMSVLAKANKNDKIEIVSNTKIERFEGEQKLEKVKCLVAGKQTEFAVDGVFVSLGKTPATKAFEGAIKLDEKGFVETDEKMQTSLAGVYAVGDVRNGVLKQIVTACSDGAIAGQIAASFAE